MTYEENSEGNSIQFTISTDDVNGYTKVENGRLYLVLGNTKKISPTSAVLTNISVMRSRMQTAHTASSS